jgi:hypothetical protein
MRRRPFVTIALVAVLGSVVALAYVGTAVGSRSNTEGSVQRVTEPAAVVVAIRSVTAPARTLPAPAIPTVPTLSSTALWLVLAVSLVIPAGSLAQSTRRRRAPPLLVI